MAKSKSEPSWERKTRREKILEAEITRLRNDVACQSLTIERLKKAQRGRFDISLRKRGAGFVSSRRFKATMHVPESLYEGTGVVGQATPDGGFIEGFGAVPEDAVRDLLYHLGLAMLTSQKDAEEGVKP